MLDVQFAGSLACVFEVIEEEVHRAARQVLSAFQEFGRPRLSLVSTDVGRLILEVEDEPKLDAGIGNGQMDAVVFRLLDGLSHVRMCIDIKHAPDLVVGPTSTSPLGTQLGLLRADRLVDE